MVRDLIIQIVAQVDQGYEYMKTMRDIWAVQILQLSVINVFLLLWLLEFFLPKHLCNDLKVFLNMRFLIGKPFEYVVFGQKKIFHQ